MTNKYCFIVNRASNTHRADGFFQTHESEVRSLFPGAEFIYINSEDSIRDIAQKAAKKYKIIVACGGDGTVKETAIGLLNSGSVLGVLPIGSGNDFAKSIGLSTSFTDNLRIIRADNRVNIDVIQFNDEYFLNTLGIGLDGLTNYYAASLKRFLGKLRYFAGGILALLKAQKFKFKLMRGELKSSPLEGESWMIVCANGAVEGGKYRVSPESSNRDGILEVILVKPVSRLKVLIEFLKLSNGLPFSNDIIEKVKGTEFRLELKSPQFVHADGEIMHGESSYKLRLRAGLLSVIVPE